MRWKIKFYEKNKKIEKNLKTLNFHIFISNAFHDGRNNIVQRSLTLKFEEKNESSARTMGKKTDEQQQKVKTDLVKLEKDLEDVMQINVFDEQKQGILLKKCGSYLDEMSMENIEAEKKAEFSKNDEIKTKSESLIKSQDSEKNRIETRVRLDLILRTLLRLTSNSKLAKKFQENYGIDKLLALHCETSFLGSHSLIVMVLRNLAESDDKSLEISISETLEKIHTYGCDHPPQTNPNQPAQIFTNTELKHESNHVLKHLIPIATKNWQIFSDQLYKSVNFDVFEKPDESYHRMTKLQKATEPAKLQYRVVLQKCHKNGRKRLKYGKKGSKLAFSDPK